MNSSFSPLYNSANIFAKRRGYPDPSDRSGRNIFPVIVPHGKPSVLEWLNPLYYGSRRYLDY